MACGGCGFENREGTRFCVECGAPLARECPACQAPVGATQRFCGECGAALTGGPAPASAVPAPDAVRKTVTVLFADLGGSTGFGERTDAEISRQVLADYHALLQQTIDAHAGTVAKFMGDGMMATFGIPEVAEDDARRAVDAGTELQSRFIAFAAEVERRHGEALTLRVGINSGEVVIGDADADLIGDALNVAARLEKACRPGHVLVGEETWRLTRGDIAYEALGEVSVAGRARPVAIYEVAAAGSAPDAEVVAPFVGRDAEMERLVSVFDDARTASTARLVTVLGSPGVGKTRLSRELARQAAKDADAVTFETRCVRSGEATFSPVAQLIRDALDLSDDADADATRAAIAALLPGGDGDDARVADVLAGLVGAAPTRSVEETFWAIRRLVESVAAPRPMVIVIDDVQWAEPLLLDLLDHLAEWVSGAPVLLVALARPELREVRPALAEPGRPVAAVLVLDGLDARATEALAAGLLGADRLPSGLVDRLPSSTDGNPLFVRELVRMLVDDHVIRERDDGEWELTIDAEAVDVPPTIQSLLGARVERLPAPERQLLELASVVGAEFSLGALRELAGEQTPIVPLLDAMRRKELVEPTGTYWGDEPVHRFHHVLIREAAYRRLLKTTRAELHERVGEWTDRAAAGVLGEHEAAIAHHYQQAHHYRTELGTLDEHTATLGRRAAALLTTAAQRALGGDDLASAAALSTRALALLPDADRAARADLLMLACECLLASGNAAAAREVVEELGTVAGDESRLVAWADCFAAQLVGLTDPERLRAADTEVQAAAAAFADLDDGSGQAKAHQVRAGILARLGRVGDAEAELDLALAAARLADDRRRVTAVLGAAPDAALFGPSPVARAGGRCLDVVRLLRITSASPSVEAASNRCQAVLEALRGRFDVARSMLATARAAVEELGLRHGLAQTDLFAGMVELIAGDPHAAIPSLRTAFEDLGALGAGADAGIAAALLARAALVDGALDEADQMASASESLAGQNLKTAIGWRVARAEVMAAQGALAGAVALAEEAVQIAAGTDLIVDHADACAALSQLRARAGDERGAEAARADAVRLYDQKGATVLAGRLAAAAPPGPVEYAAPTAPPVDLEDLDAATARFEELSAVEPRHPRAENVASRAWSKVFTLSKAGDPAELAGLFAEDHRFADLRPIVGLGEHDRDGAARVLAATRDEWEVDSPTSALAVRGDHLALSRCGWFTQGTESFFLSLTEVNRDGTVVACTLYAEDQLAQAVADLDARYLAGEGLHPAAAATISTWAAAGAGEWDGYLEWCAPDFRLIDHRSLAWPELDREGFVNVLRATDDAVPDMVQVLRKVFVGPGVNLTISDASGTADGGRFEWVAYGVNQVDEHGRLHRLELFDERDWEAALARFDELAADAEGPPALENAAVAIGRSGLELVQQGRFDDLRAQMSDDLVVDSQRWHGQGSVPDADGYVESLRVLRDLFTSLAIEPIAIRGERQSVLRVRATDTSGNELVILFANQLDEQGLVARLMNFDGDDVQSAVALLDEWFVAGEGAEHARAMSITSAWFEAINRFDFDTMHGLAAPGFVFVDRRRLGYGTIDLDGFIAWQQQFVDLGFAAIVTDIRFRGRTALTTAVNRVVDDAGGEVEWSYHTVGVLRDDGLTERVESFDTEDWDAALARFDELAADPRVTNAATRLMDRFPELARARRFDEMADLVAESYVRVDHRGGLPAPTSHGPADFVELIKATVDVGLDEIRNTPLAVRGERLALSRVDVRAADGRELVFLQVHEWDGEQLVYASHYDEDDLAAAQRELEGRFVAAGRAAHTKASFEEVAEGSDHRTPEIENTSTRVLRGLWSAAIDRRWDDVGATLAPDVVRVDHHSGISSAVTEGAAAYLEVLHAAFDRGEVDRVDVAPLAVRGDQLSLSRVVSVAQGFEIVMLMLVELDEHEQRIIRLSVHDEPDLAAAIMMLDARHAEMCGSDYTAGERSLAQCFIAWHHHDWNALASVFEPDFTRDDRTKLGMGVHDLASYLRSLREFSELIPGVTPYAAKVHAERGALLVVWPTRPYEVDGSAFAWDVVYVIRSSPSGRAAHLVSFDSADWDDALALFDEWSAELATPSPTLQNTATRALERMAEMMRDGDLDGLATLYPEDAVCDDRRTGVSSGVSVGRAATLDLIRSLLDVGLREVTHEVLAVRGDDLALAARRTARDDGFELALVTVVEVDAEGRMSRALLFDRSDLVTAVEALEQRRLERHGSTMLRSERWHLDDTLRVNRGEEDLGRLAPGYRIVDHTYAGFGDADADGMQAQLDVMRSLVSSLTILPAKIHASERAVLARYSIVGVDQDGANYRWEMASVQGYDEIGHITESHSFQIEQWTDAVALFDELSAQDDSPPAARPGHG